MFRLLNVLLLCAAVAAAQRRAPAPQRPQRDKWPIESITIEGLKHYSQDQVIRATGLKVGQEAGKPEFEAARDRLVATGAFETVGYRFAPAANGKGYAASFQVVEVEPVYPVRFEDLGVLEKEIDAFLRSRDPMFAAEVPATSAVLDRFTKLVQEFVAARGMKEKIAGRVTPSGPERFEIVFRPARNRPAVAEISFEGNQVVPTQALREAISGVAVGQQYSEPRFRELLDTSVRPIYEQRGRIRVSFPKIRTEPAKDVQGLRVIVTVNEGAAYDLGKVTVEGQTPVPAADLLKDGDFKTGDVANFEAVGQGLERIRKALERQGYMRAKVSTERHIDDAKHVVDVAVHVEEGPQIRMGKLDVKGLDLNAESEIRRLWNMKEGKPFNADYPDYFLNQVRERGVFESLGQTRSEVKVDEATNTAAVTLYFGAAPPEPERRKRPQPGEGAPI